MFERVVSVLLHIINFYTHCLPLRTKMFKMFVCPSLTITGVTWKQTLARTKELLVLFIHMMFLLPLVLNCFPSIQSNYSPCFKWGLGKVKLKTMLASSLHH